LSIGLAARTAGQRASVRILDVRGRVLRTLMNDTLPGGAYGMYWDLRDDRGLLVPAGVYLVHARAGEFVATQRIVVIR
jgi:hypothetical protein